MKVDFSEEELKVIAYAVWTLKDDKLIGDYGIKILNKIPKEIKR